MKDFSHPKTQLNRRTQDDSEKPQKSLPLLLRIVFLAGGIFLVGVVLFNLPHYFFQPANTIRIHGNHVLSAKHVNQLLDIDKDNTWFDLDPYILSLNLTKHPWVNKAIVHRTFPLSIDVFLTERVPIAYLKTKSGLFLLGNDCLVLKVLSPENGWDLPVIVNNQLKGIKIRDKLSKASLSNVLKLVELLKTDKTLPLGAVSEIHMSDPFNIELITMPYGIKIKMGYENFEQKLNKLHYFTPKFKELNKKIKYLDLRYHQGVVVKR